MARTSVVICREIHFLLNPAGVNARAKIRHANPLECSDYKIFECERSLLMRKSLLVSNQITYTHMQAKSILSKLFISEVNSTNLKGENANKSATPAKACMQKASTNRFPGVQYPQTNAVKLTHGTRLEMRQNVSHFRCQRTYSKQLKSPISYTVTKANSFL